MSKKIHEKHFPEGIFQVYNNRPDFNLLHTQQTHSCIILDSPLDADSDTEADGIILARIDNTHLPIAIKTADCLPILLIGHHKVALIHAGWKGLADGILKNTQLIPLNIHTIYIGPSLHDYEVQEDFKNNFPLNQHFYSKEGKLYFNLQAEVQSQCEKLFPNCKVYNSNICTLKNPDYNSYRRDKTPVRNWNIFKFNS